jgi:hypothetical protein
MAEPTGSTSINAIRQQLDDALIAAAIDAFTRAREKHATEGIYAAFLGTDNTYRYVFDSVATEQGLRRTAAKYLAKPRYRQEFETIERMMGELRWSLGDSPYLSEFHDAFARSNELLHELRTSTPDTDADYIAACRLIHECMTSALLHVRRQGLFGNDVLLSIFTDDQSDEERLLNAEPLNDAELLQAFRKSLNIDPGRLKRLRQIRWVSDPNSS